MPSPNSPVGHIVDFFASVKLALIILVSLAVTSIGGTIIPQNLNPEEYIQAYGPKWYQFLSYLDMFDMYNSWWFIILMVLLVVNLVVCSAKRLPSAIRLSKPINPDKINPDFLEKQKYHSIINSAPNDDESWAGYRKTLGSRFGKPKEQKTPWGRFIWIEKGGFSRFGVYLVHASLLFIAVGGLVGSHLGFSGFLTLEEGQTATQAIGKKPAGMIDLPFSIRLDKFILEKYPNGQVSEYRSLVTVVENNREILNADIRVNHPLTYRGITFYMSTFGNSSKGTIDLKAERKSDGKKFQFHVDPTQQQSLPDGAGSFSIIELLENLMNTGPAARLVIRPTQGEPYIDWAFTKRPDNLPPAKTAYNWYLTGFELGHYAGLQVNRDPGVWFIWVGCGMMMLGFIVTYLFAHRKVFLALVEQGPDRRLILAGSTHRNPGSFQIKFNALADEIIGPNTNGKK